MFYIFLRLTVNKINRIFSEKFNCPVKYMHVHVYVYECMFVCVHLDVHLDVKVVKVVGSN